MKRNRYYQIINWLGIVVVLGITGLLFFHLNQVTGYAGNDFLNRFVYTSEWPSRHTQEINSFMKWCHSLINHTLIWNGLFVSQGLAQTLMLFPKIVFNVLNTIIFLMVGIVINALIYPLKKLNVFVLGITYLFLWFFLPDWGQNVLWLTGATYALWPALLCLLYLLPLRWQYRPKHLTLFTLAMMILSFLVGASSLNMGPTLVAITYLYFRLTPNQYNSRTYQYCSMWTIIIGSFLMLIHSIDTVNNQVSDVVALTFKYDGLLIALFIAALLIITNRHFKVTATLKNAYLMILAAALGLLCLCFSNQLNSRDWLIPTVLLIVACFDLLSILYHRLDTQTTLLILVGSAVACSEFGLVSYRNANVNITQSYQSFTTAQQIIVNNRQHHQLDCVVPPMNPCTTPYNAYYQVDYLHKQASSWVNVWMAKFYHVKKISTW